MLNCKEEGKVRSLGNPLKLVDRRLQLDCTLVRQCAVVITFAAEVRFQFRDQIRKPQSKLHVGMYLIFLQDLKTESLHLTLKDAR